VLAIVSLLTCLHYLATRRRRYPGEFVDTASPAGLLEKNGHTAIPVSTSSQTATTTFINDGAKETKISTYTEQLSNGTTALTNGHGPSETTNGHVDPSELRLLQHEHH
jgi:hypothetical protein